MSDTRQRAERRGRAAEWIATFYLLAKGYRILGRRVRTPFGEIDIAAFRDGVLVMIEVKARRDLAAGLYAVSPIQQGRIANAALAAAGRWRLTGAPLRFDVIVVGAGWPRHLRGAWDGQR